MWRLGARRPPAAFESRGGQAEKCSQARVDSRRRWTFEIGSKSSCGGSAALEPQRQRVRPARLLKLIERAFQLRSCTHRNRCVDQLRLVVQSYSVGLS